MKWFRLYDEIIDDPKIRRMRSPAKVGITMILLCLANRGQPRGSLTIGEGLPFTVEEIAQKAMATVKQTRETIRHLISIGILTPTPTPTGEILTFTNWSKRQYESDDVTARVRKYRDIKKNETLQNRSGNVTETPPDTDTDTDTDTDGLMTGKPPDEDIKNNLQISTTPTNKNLITELTTEYRNIEGITSSNGDFSFIGALYNEYGYDKVYVALNTLQMVIATQQLSKPLVYLRGILKNESGGFNNNAKSNKSKSNTGNDDLEEFTINC